MKNIDITTKIDIKKREEPGPIKLDTKSQRLSQGERLELIDSAIDSLLLSLQQGINITEYELDGVKVVKNSALECLKDLQGVRRILTQKTKTKKYYF